MVENLSNKEVPRTEAEEKWALLEESREMEENLKDEVKLSAKESQETNLYVPSVEEAFFQINSLRIYGTFEEIMLNPDDEYRFLEALLKDSGEIDQMPNRDSRRTIVAIQVLLDNQWYDVWEMDGILKSSKRKTSKTMEAIKEFQKDNGIKPVDGVPWPKTLQKLMEKAAREVRGHNNTWKSNDKPDDKPTNWLKSLTDKQAENLSKGGHIYLNWLTNITDKQVETLCRWSYTWIELNWLKNITDKQAESLWKESRVVELNWLEKITDKQAEYLWKVEQHVSLNWLKSLTDKQAEELWGVTAISLNWLTNITDKQVENLLKTKKNSGSYACLELNWLTSITDKQATELAKVTGVLSLSWLKSITDKQATELAKGHYFIMNINEDILTTKQKKILWLPLW